MVTAVPRQAQEFAEQLRLLRVECGSPSYARLRRGSALLAPATVSDALRARVVPRLEFVLAFVTVCLQHADTVGATVSAESRDSNGWQRRWRRMRGDVDAERASRRNRAGTAVAPGPPWAPAPDGKPRASVPDDEQHIPALDGNLQTFASGFDAGPMPAQGRGSSGDAVPWQLPNAPRNLVGRSAGMSWLDEVLLNSDAATPVAVLEGMGGIGKTALALAWGHRSRARFPDGQLFADLGGFGQAGPRSTVEVLGGFLRSLGAAPGSIGVDLNSSSAQFRTLVADRRVLIVLDNVANAGQVRPLLPATPGAAVIVTTRSSLVGLAARDGARRREMTPLSQADAVAVLARDLPTLPDHRLHAVAVACGNLPLALRLAASRLHLDPGGTGAALLAAVPPGGAAVLRALDSGGDPDSDIATVLSWSLSGRSETELRAMRLLPLTFAAEIDSYAVAALLDLPVGAARSVMSSLAAGHLLERPAPDRWRMHDLVAAWAGTQAARLAPAQRSAAQRRLLGYYLHVVDKVDRLLLPQRGRPELVIDLPRPAAMPRLATAGDALGWADSALPALIGAVRMAAEIGEHAAAAALPHVLLSYLNLRKPWSQWITMCEIGLDSAGFLADPDVVANLNVALGIVFRETGALTSAAESQAAARLAYREAGNSVGESMALNNLANIFKDEGHREQACAALAEAVGILSATTDGYRTAIALHNLAEVELELGRFEDAMGHARSARDAALGAGDTIGAAITGTTIGRILLELGEFAAAQQEFTRALSVQRAGSDRYDEATTLKQLGRLFLTAGRRVDAVAPLREAVAILTELGDPAVSEVSALLDRAGGGSDGHAGADGASGHGGAGGPGGAGELGRADCGAVGHGGAGGHGRAGEAPSVDAGSGSDPVADRAAH